MDVLYNVLYIHTYWLPISIFEYQLWIKLQHMLTLVVIQSENQSYYHKLCIL